MFVKNKALIAEIDAEGMRVMADTAKPSYERMMSRGGAVYDFVYFGHSESSVPIILNR